MTNGKRGHQFENEFCEMLFKKGFWVYNTATKSSGQPADVIAVKNCRAYLIDCKVCDTDKGFALKRIEENQKNAMNLWAACGNGIGWFALKLDGMVFMFDILTLLERNKSYISPSEIIKDGITFERWVANCQDY